MKSLVVNETKYGNTENLARAVVEVLGDYGEYWVAPVRSIAALSAEEDRARAWAAKSLGRAHGRSHRERRRTKRGEGTE